MSGPGHVSENEICPRYPKPDTQKSTHTSPLKLLAPVQKVLWLPLSPQDGSLSALCHLLAWTSDRRSEENFNSGKATVLKGICRQICKFR